jgi:methionyl-tRNA formyltransferase
VKEKNILCFGYRDWALNIYHSINEKSCFSVNVFQSRDKVNFDFISSFKPDYILFYGWSWIVDKSITDNFKCVMLHPSPLPKYRGGSPIQNQIINNEVDSSVTLFFMDQGMDSGDIIAQQYLSLKGSIKDIFDRIEKIGYGLTMNFLQNGYTATQQKNEEATYCKRRKPEESEITLDDLSNAAPEYIYNKIRMLADPYPNAYIKLKDGSKLFIKEVSIAFVNSNV